MRQEYDVLANSNNQIVILPHRNNTLKEITEDTEVEVTMNHLFLFLGFALNLLTIIVIVCNTSIHKSTIGYILSLVLSNFILLLDTLRNVIAKWFNIQIYLDEKYITNLTFKASILTLAMLTIDRYLLIRSSNSLSVYNSLCRTVSQFKTAIKSVIIIWIMTSMATAMELHLYFEFKWEGVYKHNVDPTVQIFVIYTFIFLFLPLMLIIFLGSLIAYELEKLKLLGEVSKKDVEGLRLLAGLITGFFITMVPYQVALTLEETIPEMCCSEENKKLYFTIVKGATVIIPAICFATCKQMRAAFKDTILFCRCNFRKV